MILKRLRLENIRSYADQEIVFPAGSLLLSGDIGSGKSTILLAIDFALFGIQRSLSGASILRHGKDAGSVELEFETDGRHYTIKRTLKRKGDSVRQAAGFIESNGTRKDLTAQEAKSFIIELLGYPQQAIRADSALMYRYTVYTPQEQMRHIIEADSDERLDIIRRLFGMDRYKRIAENAEIYAKEIRGKARELSGSISDLSEKRKEHESLSKEMSEQSSALKTIKDDIAKQDKSVSKKKEELELLQKKVEGMQEIKQQYASLKAEYKMLMASVPKLKAAIDETQKRLSDLDKRIDGFKDFKIPKSTPKEIDSQKSDLEKKERASISRSAALGSEIASLSAILEKGVCGTCRQKVADRTLFSEGIETKRKELEALKAEQKSFLLQLEDLRRQSSEVQAYELLLREKQSLEEQRADKIGQKERYFKEHLEAQTKAKKSAELANELARQIKDDPYSKEFKERQKEYEELRAQVERQRRLESAVIEKISGMGGRLLSLESEIRKKETAEKEMQELIRLDRWLREFFVMLMGTIERHVLVNVQNEFNSLFQKWFSMLVMDEGLVARVGEDFSVIIEQDGFETQYSFMSGGERTATALAYRLALNRVINDLTERIKTRDLLILDEPTDGFSTEQMASVRDVLSELNTKQTIIVSHEPKVEGFVDQTLRITKENNTSRVLTG